MDELLTTKQVQELLQVDRTTIYRMLNDGRLTGIKIGQQWRFSKKEIEALLTGAKNAKPQTTEFSSEVLPLHCLQSIQDVFAEISEIGSITLSPDGKPLTTMSNPSQFCTLVRSVEQGKEDCRHSWLEVAEKSRNKTTLHTCHAGLQCIASRVEIDNHLSALLLACQFKTQNTENQHNQENINQLAKKYNMDPETLLNAYQKIPTIDARLESSIHEWLVKVAKTFEDIGIDRAELISRLKQIAAMSTIEI